MMTGPDFAEGVAALTARRPPHFADLPAPSADPGGRPAPTRRAGSGDPAWLGCRPWRTGRDRGRRWRRG